MVAGHVSEHPLCLLALSGLFINLTKITNEGFGRFASNSLQQVSYITNPFYQYYLHQNASI